MIKSLFSLAGRVLRRTPLARSKFLNRLQARIVLRLHKSDSATVGPFRVRFAPSDLTIAKKIILYGEYDKAQIELLCSFIEPGDDVLDIGANIGIYSLYLSRAVGPKGRVLAFEPDPSNLAVLRHNLESNGCENVEVIPCCLGDAEGEVKLFQSFGNAGGSSLWHRNEAGGHSLVPMRIGDEVMSEHGFRPRVAKIDVEGAEAMVLAGLKAHKPRVILFEYSTRLLKEVGSDPSAFLDALIAEGYDLASVDAQTGGTQGGTIDEVTSCMDKKPGGNVYGNILAVHRDYEPAGVALQPA